MCDGITVRESIMIQSRNLTKIYSTQDVETVALKSVHFSVTRGEFVAIMGPSGCGKSTLLNILGLLDNPTSGEYLFLGQDTALYNEKKRTTLRKNNIGFVFQSFNLIDELTVYENVELPLVYLNISQRKRRDMVRAKLDYMGIAHKESHFPQQLSGGQQQRTAMARALITEPRIILADEPTGNLDSASGKYVMDSLTAMNEQGTTIVMVTHATEYADFSNRVVHLFDGHIVSEHFKNRIV